VPVSKKCANSGHILISGTGRAGTTLLVKYFAALGFDVGFSEDEIKHTSGGLEHFSDAEAPLPYVIKSPHYTETVGARLDRSTLTIKYCIVPVRRIFDAAESRRRVHRQGGGPGTIWLTDDPKKQETVLALQFYKLIEALVRHNIPTYFLYFPGFAESSDALYRGLKPVLDDHGVSQEQSDFAHREVVDLNLIHRFSVIP